MKLHRITLQNYRGVRECTVEPSLTGVTVIEGNNEVGKSSIAEALDLLLTYPDDSKHGTVRAAKPIGIDVGAEVQAEVSTGEYRFVLTKRWHKDRMTQLDVLEPQRQQLTGREAHDRALAILAETMDQNLWDALRITQGAELTQAAFGNLREGSLGAALDVAADGARAGETEESLWERIQSECDRYWTKKLHSSKERNDRRDRVSTLEHELSEVMDQLRGLDAMAAEVESLTAAISTIDADMNVAGAEAEELRKQVTGLDALRREEERAEVDLARTDAEARAAKAAVDARTALLDRAEAATSELDAARAAQEAEAPEAARVEAEFQVAVEAAKSRELARQVAEQGLRTATEQQRANRNVMELQNLRERHDRVLAARQQLVTAKSTLQRVQVDDDILAAIEEAHLGVVRAGAAAQGAATLTVEALGAIEAVVDGEPHALSAGDELVRHATADVAVELPGVARFTVTSSREGRELAQGLTDAQSSLRTKCADAGVADVDAARAAHAERSDAQRIQDSAHDRISADLSGLTLEEMEGLIAGLEAEIAQHGLDVAKPEIDTSVEAQADAKAAVTAAELTLAEDARVHDEARARVTSLEAERGQLTNKLAHLTDRRERAEAACFASEEALVAARGEASDEDLQTALAQAQVATDSAAATVHDVRTRLREANADAVEEQARNAAERVERVRRDLESKRERRTSLQGSIEALGEKGMANDVDRIQTELVHLRAEHQRVEARAAASRLLLETFGARRDEARARYAAPLRDAIERLGRFVFGADLEIELNDNLSISRRTLDGRTLEFDELSTGAREQLGVLARLACATLVSGDSGVPVLFDDTLGWTDPTRLRSMGAAINAAGRTCQVIVFTCTPDRYASVGDATVVRLPQ